MPLMALRGWEGEFSPAVCCNYKTAVIRICLISDYRNNVKLVLGDLYFSSAYIQAIIYCVGI